MSEAVGEFKEPSLDSSVKPEAAEATDDSQIRIRVTDNITEVYFKLKRDTQLRRVIEGFAKRVGKESSSMRFLYEGDRITGTDTPDSLGMEEDDVIEALSQQVGGSRAATV